MLTLASVGKILGALEHYGHIEWSKRFRRNLELALDTLDEHEIAYMDREVR